MITDLENHIYDITGLTPEQHEAERNAGALLAQKLAEHLSKMKAGAGSWGVLIDGQVIKIEASIIYPTETIQ